MKKEERSIQLVTILLLFACSPGEVRHMDTYIGMWTSTSGYSVEISSNERYVFCSDAGCEEGAVTRPFGVESSAIYLQGLFRMKSSSEFEARLREIGVFEGKIERDYPDFDFTPNMGVGGHHIGIDQCDSSPCIYKGSLEDLSEGILFVKK